MQDIVIIIKDESLGNKLYSLAKILFPESGIHLVIKNDIKEVHMTGEDLEISKN